MLRIRYVFGVRMLSTLTTLTMLGGACAASNPTGARRDLGNGTAVVNVSSSLTQTVSVTPSDPTSGSNIQVRSVLVNRGSKAVQLESRACGLDYAGTLSLSPPPDIFKCMAYSTSISLAPGDSIVGGDVMRVSSAPGTYSLRVRHALQPEAWAELQVQVR